MRLTHRSPPTPNFRFQSTHPLRGATRSFLALHPLLAISIHAPLAGCDSARRRQARSGENFNPRTPCGVRPKREIIDDDLTDISIHAPLAGCDQRVEHRLQGSFISIHAPLAGCDRRRGTSCTRRAYFNPRTPCGARHGLWVKADKTAIISIHAPLAGRDKESRSTMRRCRISIHAPLAGRDLISGVVRAEPAIISIHAPLAGRDSKSAQKNAALLRKRYKYKLFVCKKCTSGDLTGTYSSKKYALFRCELLGKSVRAFGSHS